jgi:hypothetical protein
MKIKLKLKNGEGRGRRLTGCITVNGEGLEGGGGECIRLKLS